MSKFYQWLKSQWPFIKSHWPAIVALGMAAWGKFGNQIQVWVSHHPHLAGWFAIISFLIAYYAKSPILQKKEN